MSNAAQFKKLMDTARKRAKEGFGGDELPPGSYSTKVHNARVFTTEDGRTFAVVEHLVLEGEHKDKIQHQLFNMDHEVGASIWVSHMVAYGYDTSEVSTIEAVKEIMEDLATRGFTEVLRITPQKKSSAAGKRYNNLTVVEVGGASEEEPSSEEEEEETETPQEEEEKEEETSSGGVQQEEETSEESEEGETSSDEANIDIGTKIKFKEKDKVLTGTVTAIDEDAGEVQVKTKLGNKYKFPATPEKILEIID